MVSRQAVPPQRRLVLRESHEVETSQSTGVMDRHPPSTKPYVLVLYVPQPMTVDCTCWLNGRVRLDSLAMNTQEGELIPTMYSTC